MPIRIHHAETIGKPVVQFLEETGDLARFTASSLRRAITPPFRRHLIVQQMLQIGVKSLPIATLTAFFIGMVMVLQTGFSMSKFGARQLVPGAAFVALAREMIPTFTAVVVGARVSASITAELGTMRVTEQIDAMDVLNVDPIRYLVVPRFWAAVLMLPIITTYSLVLGILGGMVVSYTSLEIGPRLYISLMETFAKLTDVFAGVLKTAAFGAIMSLVGGYYGFRTHGGAEGVGRATTTSVVLTLVLSLIANYVLTSWILTLLSHVRGG